MPEELTVGEMARELAKAPHMCPASTEELEECPEDCPPDLPYDGCWQCWTWHASEAEIRRKYAEMKEGEK